MALETSVTELHY